MTATTRDRIAGAPISWGVCEVPGWGHQLTPEQVFGEMAAIGLAATEFGPVGYLPDDSAERSAVLGGHGLRAVGGFLPVVLHRADVDPVPGAEAYLATTLAAGGRIVVLAAATGVDGYDARPELDEEQWSTLLTNLDRIADRVAELGGLAVVHPHIGTLVENAADVQRVLDGSRIGLCIDTGHLAAAGADPVAITFSAPERVKHVHLKDVDADLAARVVAGELTFSDGVRRGLFLPLGSGIVGIGSLVAALENAGYDGWYVLEQDVMLDGAPDGEGPVADVRRSLDYLLSVLR